MRLTPRLSEPLPASKARLGRHRGAKVAQIDIARRLTEAICHMLTTNQPFNPLREAPLFLWPPDGPFELRPRSRPAMTPDPPTEEAIQR